MGARLGTGLRPGMSRVLEVSCLQALAGVTQWDPVAASPLLRVAAPPLAPAVSSAPVRHPATSEVRRRCLGDAPPPAQIRCGRVDPDRPVSTHGRVDGSALLPVERAR